MPSSTPTSARRRLPGWPRQAGAPTLALRFGWTISPRLKQGLVPRVSGQKASDWVSACRGAFRTRAAPSCAWPRVEWMRRTQHAIPRSPGRASPRDGLPSPRRSAPGCLWMVAHRVLHPVLLRKGAAQPVKAAHERLKRATGREAAPRPPPALYRTDERSPMLGIAPARRAGYGGGVTGWTHGERFVHVIRGAGVTQRGHRPGTCVTCAKKGVEAGPRRSQVLPACRVAREGRPLSMDVVHRAWPSPRSLVPAVAGALIYHL